MSGVLPKSRTILTILAWFLGTIGVHRFYVGKKGSGAVMVILSVLAWIFLAVGAATLVTDIMTGDTSFPILATIGYIMYGAVGLWNLIDFIMAIAGKFKDKQGRVISNWSNSSQR